MKVLLTLATLLLACAVLISAKPHHEPSPQRKAALDTCMKQFDLSKEQLHERRKNHEEKTEDCFQACVDKELGVIKEDGSIDREVSVKNLPPHVPQENATRIVDACFEQKGVNDCETAVLYRRCVMKLVPRPPRHPEEQKLHDTCKEKLGLTDEDVQKLHNARGEAKEDCFLACMGQSSGLMREDGSVDEDKLTANAPPHLAEEDVKKIVAECGSAKGENECETAVLVQKCLEKNHFRFGLHGPPPPPPPHDE